jgi:hypothetical protein
VIPRPAARSGRIPVPAWDDVLFGAAPSVAEPAAPESEADADADAGGPAPARGRRRS